MLLKIIILFYSKCLLIFFSNVLHISVDNLKPEMQVAYTIV